MTARVSFTKDTSRLSAALGLALNPAHGDAKLTVSEVAEKANRPTAQAELLALPLTQALFDELVHAQLSTGAGIAEVQPKSLSYRQGRKEQGLLFLFSIVAQCLAADRWWWGGRNARVVQT